MWEEERSAGSADWLGLPGDMRRKGLERFDVASQRLGLLRGLESEGCERERDGEQGRVVGGHLKRISC